MAKNLYPWQTYAVKRQTKVLSVEAHLSTPSGSDSSPLELHSGFSRFLITLIDKSKTPTATPRANVPCRDISLMKLKTDLAIKALVEMPNSLDGGSELADSCAYTQKLMHGLYKGRTPAEILLKNPGEKDGLLNTKKWLESNLAKFPANKAQIDAIDAAVTLLEIGELTAATTTPVVNGFDIYKTEYKHFSEKDNSGNNLIYAITVRFEPSNTYPFVCEISNCWAPIEVSPTGARRPIMNQARGTVKSSIAMSEAEWVEVINRMSDLKTYFELTNFRNLLNQATEMDEEARRNPD